MLQFKENDWTGRRTKGQKDRQTLFYRSLLATVGGPITMENNNIIIKKI